MAKIHCHSLLSGSSWTSFDEESSEEDSEAMEVDENNSSDLQTEATRLNHEDMELYGLCPSQEQFCLVVCKDCSRVVKLSSFTRHCDLLHKKAAPPPTPSPEVVNSPVDIVIDKSNIKIEELQLEDSTVKIEEVPLTVPQVNHVMPKPLPNTNKKSSASNRKSPRKVIPTREREFDADKHCGVWVQEQQKRCTRSLTCKTHALSLRRAVPGRRKKFDELLAEHKARVNNEKEQQQQNLAAMKLLESKSTNNVVKKVKTETQSKPANDKQQNNGHVNFNKEEAIEPIKETESGESEDSHFYSELSTSSHHPKPIATCSFGGRKVGHGALVFNRKQDHLRCAMLAMVEKYLNPQSRKMTGRPGAAAILHRPTVKTIGQSSNHSLLKAGSSVIGDKNKSHSAPHKNLSNFLKAPPPPRNRSVKQNNVLHGTKHSLENSYQTVLHSKPFLESSSSSNDGFDASSQAISDIGNIIASIDSNVNRTNLDSSLGINNELSGTPYTTIYTSMNNTQTVSDMGQTMVGKMNGTTASTSTNTVVQIAGQLDPNTGKVTSTAGQRESPLFFATQNATVSSLANGTGPSPPPIASTNVKGYPALSFVIQGSKPANPSPVSFSKGHSLVFNSMGMAQMQRPTSPLQQQQPQQQLQQKGKVLLRANSYPKTSGKTNNSQVKIPQSPSPQQQLSPGQPKTIIVTSPSAGQQNLYLNHMTTTPIVQLKQQVEQQQQQLQQITLQQQLQQQQIQQQQLQQHKQLNSQFTKQLPIQPRLAPAPHPPSQSLLTQQQLASQNIVIKATDQPMKSPQNTVFVTSDSHQSMQTSVVKPQSNVA